MPLPLPQAAALIREGTPFGAVAPRLSEADRDALRAWYTREPGVPVRRAKVKPATPAPVPVPVPSGDLCPKCGGLMVRTGTCSTCQSCGDSSGGCG